VIEQDPRVPAAVEEYLVGLFGPAAQGASSTARFMPTIVEERSGTTAMDLGPLLDRLGGQLSRFGVLGRSEHQLRIVVPVGITGLQQVVVDVLLPAAPGAESDAGPGRRFYLRAYAKEGIVTRHPTVRVADQVQGIAEGRTLDDGDTARG
jgi:hypothetical protein